MPTGACCLLLAPLTLFPAARAASLHGLPLRPGERISGSAILSQRPPRLVTWGDSLRIWNLDTGASTVLPAAGPWGPGGCVASLDGGQPGLALQKGSDLIWLRGPRFQTEVRIDNGIDFRDCRGIELFGRKGLLLIQRYSQVRFYEHPRQPQPRWPYVELYSIYTPSRQGTLLPFDVDGDGRPDLFCGNYWLRSPEKFDLPWRLFAIELYNEKPDSALVRLALARITGKSFPELIVSEGAADPTRLAWFERPADPKQLWTEHRLLENEGLHYPQGLLTLDANREGHSSVLVGEDNGPDSRLFLLRNEVGRFTPKVVLRGVPVRELYRFGDKLVLVSGRAVSTLNLTALDN